MSKAPKVGCSTFCCLGLGSLLTIVGLLSVGAANTIGQSRDARGLDFEHMIFGLPWWIGNRLGSAISWTMVFIGVGAIAFYLWREARESRES